MHAASIKNFFLVSIITKIISTTVAQFGFGYQQCYGTNEEFSRCGAGCVVGCDNMNSALQCNNCVAGCVCSAGYVRQFSGNTNSQCVLRSQCNSMNGGDIWSSSCSDPNAEYYPCKPGCEENCYSTVCGSAGACNQGCACKVGFVKQYNYLNALCMLKSQCLNTNINQNPFPNPNPNPYPNQCSDPNTYFSQCGSACPETCQGSNSFCSMQCIQGCFCNSGYVREYSSSNARCIRRDQCYGSNQPSTYCSESNTIYSNCGTACQETCQNSNSVCGMQCVQGCFCAQGYVRESSAYNARCVRRDLCYQTQTINGVGQCSDPNAQYLTCGTLCEETCDGRQSMCPMQCKTGCFCKPGYVKMYNNLGSFCVLRSQCIYGGGIGTGTGGINYGQKSGVCPSTIMVSQSIRTTYCSTDNDCSGQMKCCSTLFGFTCMAPDYSIGLA